MTKFKNSYNNFRIIFKTSREAFYRIFLVAIKAIAIVISIVALGFGFYESGDLLANGSAYAFSIWTLAGIILFVEFHIQRKDFQKTLARGREVVKETAIKKIQSSQKEIKKGKEDLSIIIAKEQKKQNQIDLL